MLLDNHGRPLNYLRLAITDRCNLRCSYCMPEHGIAFVNRKDLLSYEEMLLLCEVLAEMGIDKVRITGGEPFVRKGAIEFIEQLSEVKGINQIHITTNGVNTLEYIPRLKTLGLAGVNLSLDTLDRDKFTRIARRDDFNRVMQSFSAFLEAGIPTKLNMVVMQGINDDEIIPMAELTRQFPIQVRFLEEMPFNGGNRNVNDYWNHIKILAHLKSAFPFIQQKKSSANSTSSDYQIPGAAGTLGIIASFSRTFCGSCNRIRITPQGQLKTCLYDNGVMNIRDLMRANNNDRESIKSAFLDAFGKRYKDGHEAERNRKPVNESMSSIGG